MTQSGSPNVGDLPLGAFQPAGMARLYVLGGCADVPRDVAAQILRPLALIDLGQRIGSSRGRGGQVGWPRAGSPARRPAPATCGGGRHRGVPRRACGRCRTLPTLPQDARALPVLGKYDVVVIGGGTAGARPASAPAGEGPGRWSSSTCTALGGVGTAGPSRTTTGATASASRPRSPAGQSVGHRAEGRVVADGELLKAGARDLVRRARLRGVGPGRPGDRGGGGHAPGPRRGAGRRGGRCHRQCRHRRGGRRDCHLHRRRNSAMQGTGLPPRQAGRSLHQHRLHASSTRPTCSTCGTSSSTPRTSLPQAFDLGQLIDTRERRRIVGDFTFTLLDQIARPHLSRHRSCGHTATSTRTGTRSIPCS